MLKVIRNKQLGQVESQCWMKMSITIRYILKKKCLTWLADNSLPMRHYAKNHLNMQIKKNTNPKFLLKIILGLVCDNTIIII